MKHKLLKLNAVLLLGIGLSPMYAQTSMNVKAINGTNTTYVLSSIRKLTFPSTGNMTVTKTTAGTDNYTLSAVRNLNFNLRTDIENIEDSGRKTMNLYPNPVIDVLSIQLTTAGSQTATIELLTIDGKLLYKAYLSGNIQINVSQFQQGIYLCRIIDGTNVETSKFIKK